MEAIHPVQMDKRIQLRWFGVEAARNAAQVQQQIAAANVMRGIPPDQYPGYKFNIAPLLVHLAESTFGPRLAPLIFTDVRESLAASPEVENDMLEQGFEVLPHMMDDDGAHLASIPKFSPHQTVTRTCNGINFRCSKSRRKPCRPSSRAANRAFLAALVPAWPVSRVSERNPVASRPTAARSDPQGSDG